MAAVAQTKKIDGTEVLQLMLNEERRSKKEKKRVLIVCTIIIALLVGMFMASVIFLHSTYIKNTEQIILSKKAITIANDWERLPETERKEKLRERYYEILKYYTLKSKTEEKLREDIMLDSFNSYYDCTNLLRVNFFLPLAYMKVMSNFNPNYTRNYRFGVAFFFVKEGADISNLPIIKDPHFNVTYKGEETLRNPIESMKLLVAKINDLKIIFENRTDWVVLSLLLNEYEVIDKYWKSGKGRIPDDFYRKELGTILTYYYTFKNWRVIPTPEEQAKIDIKIK